MSTVAARSVSPWVLALINGATRCGRGMGHGYVLLGDTDVMAITPPGKPRMPNGIEVDAPVGVGDRVWVGGGHLTVRDMSVVAGPVWEPVPMLRSLLAVSPHVAVQIEALAGAGPGLTPVGDDVLVGYIAGLALTCHEVGRASLLAEAAARRTTALSRTLLQLAVRGALPEPAHPLVEQGDLDPLLRFGATSGAAIGVGLALALHTECVDDNENARHWTVQVPLPAGAMAFAVSTRPVFEPASLHESCMA